LHLS
jgi:hypothetical protein